MKKVIDTTEYKYILAIIFMSSIIVLLSFFNTIGDKREFSNIERRNLKTFENSNINILKDDFVEKIENVLKDQFVYRDTYINIKSYIDTLTAKNYSNNVYVLNDRYIEKEVPIDYDKLANQLQKIQSDLQYVDANAYFVMFPTTYSVYHDKLPNTAPMSYQKDVFSLLPDVFYHSKVHYINVFDEIEKLKNKMEIFYKTDHHVTTDAMYKLKNLIFENMYIDDYRDYERVVLSDNFKGSLMSKSGIFKDISDEIVAYMDIKPTRYKMFVYGDNLNKASIYDFDKLNSYDQYLTFVGTNTSLINIVTENYSKKRLLIIKDSFANCFIPFLLPFYSKIDIVDPRYVEDIKSVVAYENYDDILFFYNYNTFQE